MTELTAEQKRAFVEAHWERAWVDALTAPASMQEIAPGERIGSKRFAEILAARLKAVSNKSFEIQSGEENHETSNT